MQNDQQCTVHQAEAIKKSKIVEIINGGGKFEKLILIDFDNTLVDYEYKETEHHIFKLLKQELNQDNVKKIQYTFGQMDGNVLLNEVFTIPAFWCKTHLVNKYKFTDSDAWSAVFNAMEKIFKVENLVYEPTIGKISRVAEWIINQGANNNYFVLVTNSPKWLVTRVLEKFQQLYNVDLLKFFNEAVYLSEKPSYFNSDEFVNLVKKILPSEIAMIGDGIKTDNIEAVECAKKIKFDLPKFKSFYYKTPCRPSTCVVDADFEEMERLLPTFENFVEMMK